MGIIDALRELLGWKTSKRKKWGIILKAAITIIEKENSIMATLAELKALSESQITRIDALNTALDGFRAAVDGIKAELEALKQRDLTPAQQAQVDSIAENMTLSIQKIEDTLTENTPAAPEPEPEV
jgi:uncharacterized coiled-coil DUF342 family protein